MEKSTNVPTEACPICHYEIRLPVGKHIRFQCPGCSLPLEYKGELTILTERVDKNTWYKRNSNRIIISLMLFILFFSVLIIYIIIEKNTKIELLDNDLANEKALNGNYKLLADRFLFALNSNDTEKMVSYMTPQAYKIFMQFTIECRMCFPYRVSPDGKNFYYRNVLGMEVFVPFKFSVVNGKCLIDF